MSKAVKIRDESIEFDDGSVLSSGHDQDCCENHYLSFKDLTLKDFEGLEFDLTKDDFFRRIEDYGIELIPLHGHPVKIPGYGSNSGCYSSNLSLELLNGKIFRSFDISDCQTIGE